MLVIHARDRRVAPHVAPQRLLEGWFGPCVVGDAPNRDLAERARAQRSNAVVGPPPHHRFQIAEVARIEDGCDLPLTVRQDLIVIGVAGQEDVRDPRGGALMQDVVLRRHGLLARNDRQDGIAPTPWLWRRHGQGQGCSRIGHLFPPRLRRRAWVDARILRGGLANGQAVSFHAVLVAHHAAPWPQRH